MPKQLPALDPFVSKVPTASTVPSARDQSSPSPSQATTKYITGAPGDKNLLTPTYIGGMEEGYRQVPTSPTINDSTNPPEFSRVSIHQFPQQQHGELALNRVAPFMHNEGGSRDNFICILCRNAIVRDALCPKNRQFELIGDSKFNNPPNGYNSKNGYLNGTTTTTTSAAPFVRISEFSEYDQESNCIYPKILTEDKADIDLDCISLPVADDTCSRSASGSGDARRASKDIPQETYGEAALKIMELLITFVAVVCLWGSIDDVVEVIVKSDPKWGICVYLAFFAGALLLQLICNKLLRTSMSLARGIDLF